MMLALQNESSDSDDGDAMQHPDQQDFTKGRADYPYAVLKRGRRPPYQFTSRQWEELESHFMANPFCPKGRKQQLGQLLGIVPDAILTWFRNSRQRLRKKLLRCKEGLVPYGGSSQHVALKLRPSLHRNFRAPTPPPIPSANCFDDGPSSTPQLFSQLRWLNNPRELPSWTPSTILSDEDEDSLNLNMSYSDDIMEDDTTSLGLEYSHSSPSEDDSDGNDQSEMITVCINKKAEKPKLDHNISNTNSPAQVKENFIDLTDENENKIGMKRKFDNQVGMLVSKFDLGREMSERKSNNKKSPCKEFSEFTEHRKDQNIQETEEKPKRENGSDIRKRKRRVPEHINEASMVENEIIQLEKEPGFLIETEKCASNERGPATKKFCANGLYLEENIVHSSIPVVSRNSTACGSEIKNLGTCTISKGESNVCRNMNKNTFPDNIQDRNSEGEENTIKIEVEKNP